MDILLPSSFTKVNVRQHLLGQDVVLVGYSDQSERKYTPQQKEDESIGDVGKITQFYLHENGDIDAYIKFKDPRDRRRYITSENLVFSATGNPTSLLVLKSKPRKD